MKASLVILLCLIGNVCCTIGYRTGELYRALNITCYEGNQLKKLCDMSTRSLTTPIMIGCPSVIEETNDQCAVLYQLIKPSVACDLASRGPRPRLQYLYSEWWSNSPLISPDRLSHFVFNLKQSLVQHFLVKFTDNNKCFSTADILESQGLSINKCFAQSSVGQLCSAIVDKLSRGESICEDEVFGGSTSCINDVVEQLFNLLTVDNDMLTLTEFHALINKQLFVDHHRNVREEDHRGDNDDDHDEEQVTQNCITESRLKEKFNHVAEEFDLTDIDGNSCHQHNNDSDEITESTNCSLIYNVCHDLILKTQLTNKECLAGNTSTDGHSHDGDSVSQSQVYGYSVLSAVIISVLSQLGVITVLFSYNNHKAKYIISLLIAVGVSTLVSDAILHLIPQAFGGHGGEEDDGHGHDDDEEHGHDQTTIWRGCCVLAGILLFYMFELTLGMVKNKMEKRSKSNKNATSISMEEICTTTKELEEDDTETKQRSGCLNLQMDDHPPYYNPRQGFCRGISSVAWMIILGDTIHNFADGIAIGASFSSSLGVGASTSLAVFFHELPHEFGDFAILLSSGMKWYIALFYNSVSAASAIVGVFIGVAIGNASEDSTAWILSITAGVFLYVALVDLLPGLMEILKGCKDQKSYWIYMICHLTGFMIGFVILLLIAIYEEDINSLID